VQVAKNLKDLPSPTLAIVAERLKLTNVHEGALQSHNLQFNCFLCQSETICADMLLLYHVNRIF
jgi:tryptophanase